MNFRNISAWAIRNPVPPIVLFIALWWIAAKPRPRGVVSACFLIGYGAFRFGVEFTRGFQVSQKIDVGPKMHRRPVLCARVLADHGFQRIKIFMKFCFLMMIFVPGYIQMEPFVQLKLYFSEF